MAKRANEIIGFHLGWDLREVSEGRYQRYSSPNVYVCGGDYFAVNDTAPKHDVSSNPWEKVREYYGRKVWRARTS
jgi:hypothetical protein